MMLRERQELLGERRQLSPRWRQMGRIRGSRMKPQVSHSNACCLPHVCTHQTRKHRKGMRDNQYLSLKSAHPPGHRKAKAPDSPLGISLHQSQVSVVRACLAVSTHDK